MSGCLDVTSGSPGAGTVDQTIEAARVSGATTLDLSRRRLRRVREPVRDLTHLNLSGNQLTESPDWVGELTSLTNLYSSGNQLAALPDSFGNLAKLTQLRLGDNRLAGLPEWFRNLTLPHPSPSEGQPAQRTIREPSGPDQDLERLRRFRRKRSA
ncbi:leucine-rich repeat domain-containing protein [Nonomuraea terrae]|uniref:leucine-rich repeat domain-containing protein n=1 Tax=Nonomuraea terrae TaxID=2530383 RepID=UPI003CCC72A0